MKPEEELGDGSSEEDTASYGRGEVLVVGAPAEHFLLEVEGIFVTPRLEVKV